MKKLLTVLAFSMLPMAMQAQPAQAAASTSSANVDIDLGDLIDLIDTNFRKKKFRCVAENRRGRRFVAKAKDRKAFKARRKAARKALRKCRDNSRRPRTCEVVRCRRVGGGF